MIWLILLAAVAGVVFGVLWERWAQQHRRIRELEKQLEGFGGPRI